MTLLQKINRLTWFNLVNNLKDILRQIIGAETQSPYKSYVALLSGNGLNNLTVNVLENGIDSSITIIQSSPTYPGGYKITSNNSFITDKTYVKVNEIKPFNTYSPIILYINQSEIIFDIGDGEGNNEVTFKNLPVEIRVYS